MDLFNERISERLTAESSANPQVFVCAPVHQVVCILYKEKKIKNNLKRKCHHDTEGCNYAIILLTKCVRMRYEIFENLIFLSN